jgi:hypothetical protein
VEEVHVSTLETTTPSVGVNELALRQPAHMEEQLRADAL